MCIYIYIYTSNNSNHNNDIIINNYNSNNMVMTMIMMIRFPDGMEDYSAQKTMGFHQFLAMAYLMIWEGL